MLSQLTTHNCCGTISSPSSSSPQDLRNPSMESLTVSSINDCIDEVLNSSESSDEQWRNRLKEKGFRLQRATTPKECKSLLEFASGSSQGAPLAPGGAMPAPIPYFFGIGVYSLHAGAHVLLCGVMTMYMAYSTWDGRCLFIDRLDFPNHDHEDMEKTMLRPLAKIAVKLDCARLNWRRIDCPSWYENDPLPPEILHGWLTLQMEQSAMIKYTGTSEDDAIKPVECKMLSRPIVHDSVKECLAVVNAASSNNHFRFRLSTGDDVDTIARLVQGLAVYEKEPDAVNVTPENYRCDGGSNEPLFYCLLLEDADVPEGTEPYSCGMAFIYFGYELGKGRFLYLEDLYLEDAYRKRGGGSLAMKSLARICLALGCQNFYWVALDWNTPALNLYEKIGAKVQKSVSTVRFTDETLRSFANATLEGPQ